MTDAIKELSELLAEAGLEVRFGLRAQGHIPTIERMLKEGRTWEEIGRAISWDPETAKQWYRDDQLIEMVRKKCQAELKDWLNQVGALACTCNLGGGPCIRCRARTRFDELRKQEKK